MTEERLKREFTVVDSACIDGIMWWLYEHKEYGEDEMIVTNGDRYVYTEENIHYTVDNLDDEYEVFYLD